MDALHGLGYRRTAPLYLIQRRVWGPRRHGGGSRKRMEECSFDVCVKFDVKKVHLKIYEWVWKCTGSG